MASISNLAMSMTAYERSLQQASSDLTHADDPNYTRRRVVFEDMAPDVIRSKNVLTFGNGIQINRTERITDESLVNKVFIANGHAAFFQQESRDYKILEDIFNEEVGFNADSGDGSHGLRQSLDDFFASWSGLQSGPGMPGGTEEVKQKTILLIDAIKTRYQLLKQNAQDMKVKIAGTREQINKLGDEIANITRKIKENAVNGTAPNDMLDARDKAITDLSQLVDCKVVYLKDFGLIIKAGEFNLVSTEHSKHLPEEYNIDDIEKPYFVEGDLKFYMMRGEISAYMQALGRTEDLIQKLDHFSNTLRNQVNINHQAGVNKQGESGTFFFKDPGEEGALGVQGLFLAEHIEQDPNNIAKGISTGAEDGTIAHAINRFKDGKIDVLGDLRIVEYITEMEARVARESERSQHRFGHEENVRSQLEEQKLSVTGVDRRGVELDILKRVNDASKLVSAIRKWNQLEEELLRMFG